MTNREIADALCCCARMDCRSCPNAPERCGCIYELKLAAAGAIRMLLQEVLDSKPKLTRCCYNERVVCDHWTDQPERCNFCDEKQAAGDEKKDKYKICIYNSAVLCDWPEERPERCMRCPASPERTEWECEA